MKIERLLNILYVLLNNEKVTINYLAEKFEVSRRTIFRDLESLNVSGIPIVSYPGVGGGVGIMEGYKLDKSLFDNEDITTVLAGLNSLKSLGDDKKIEYLINKIIPTHRRESDIESDIIIDLSSWFILSDTQNLVIDFRKAIANHICLELEYHSKSRFSKRVVEPYKLVFKYDDWYIYAFCRERGDFRLFKLNRISAYRLLDENYISRTIEKDALSFSLPMQHKSTQTKGDLNKIVLEYALENKEFLIDKLGAQHFTDYENSGQIEFETADMSWATDLIFSLQDKVKVIQPTRLKTEILSRIENIKSLYK